MTKYVDFTWKVPVPQELLAGTVADKWVEEKDSADLEHEAFFRSVSIYSTLSVLSNHGGRCAIVPNTFLYGD